MNTELMYLTWVTVLTGVLWLPYIVNRMFAWGLMDTVGYPVSPKPQAVWAARLMKAHSNAVENLVVFAVLVLVAQAAGITGGAVASAAALYFWARVVHVLAFTFGMPWVRTLAFVVGWVAQVMIAWQLLTA